LPENFKPWNRSNDLIVDEKVRIHFPGPLPFSSADH